MSKKFNIKETLSKAKFICSKKEYCISVIEKKINEWTDNCQITEQVIKKLLQENYIDEKRYANAYANDKLRFNKWGKNRIKYELKMKNIPDMIIRDVLESINYEVYNEILLAELKKKNKTLSNKEKIKKKQSLIRFAVGRGFELDLVISQIENL